MQHLSAIDAHIQKIAPQWNKFRAEHPGFQDLHLFAYTGGGDMFGAYGTVANEEQIAELRKFMENSDPPRPIFLDSIEIISPEELRSDRTDEPKPVA